MYHWNEEKNQWLRENRGVCFDDVVSSLKDGGYVGVFPHSNTLYSHQNLLLVNINNYIYEVPFIPADRFLKTVYPSRKFTKKYLNKEL